MTLVVFISAYASDLFSWAGLADSKIASMLVEANLNLVLTDESTLSSPTLYCEFTGNLIISLTITRPDVTNQFILTLLTTQFSDVLWILRYVKDLSFCHFTSPPSHVYSEEPSPI